VVTSRAASPARRPQRAAARFPLPGGWKLGAAAGTLGAEGAAGYLSPGLGAALAAADVLVPLAVAVVLLAAVLLGSDQTCERVFRLLRWATNRPEPPSPGQITTQS
jgi:hypothetical protein